MKPGTYTIDQENRVVLDIVTPPPEAIIPGTGNAEADENMATGGSEHHKVSAEEQSKFLVSQAKAQGEQIVQDAIIEGSNKRAEIIKKAEAEAIQIHADAQDKGYSDGMNACTEQANAIRAEAQQVLESAYAERKALEESLEPEMVSLVIDVIEKLIGDTIKLNPAAVVNLIKQGLSASTITGDVIVYVSPQDFEQVQANKEELLAMADGSVKLEIVKDLSLNPTDCVIETPFGNVDSSLGQQYENLKSDLMYILNQK
jgi:flagellar assembly protein FliH